MSTYERHVLDNGLRVVTANLPEAQSVTCMVMLAAGSRYETPETNGIAHFSEHMFFKGTERRPSARDIAGEIDAIGGEFNAFTGKEYTAYYVKCAAEHRDIALDVLVDMLRNSRFDSEEIDREKGVIVEEKETVRSATRETFNSYLDRWYHPSRMVIGLGGRIGDDAVARTQELLGDLPAVETGEPEPTKPYENGRVKVFTKQSDQAHLVLGVPSYPLEHPDRYVLQVLSTVLGGGMSSRLFTEVRERRGLAYYVFGLNHSYTDTGSLYAQAGVDIKRIDEAVTTILGELRTIAAEAVPADELEKARNFSKGRFVLQLESPQGLILFGLRREVLELRVPDLDEVLEGLNAVTGDDVQRVAQELIQDEKLRLALIGPFDDPDHFEKLL